jgi:uncharacterized membrane protein
MAISSLARSLPGQNLLPAPKGRKVPALGVKFYTEVKQIIKLVSIHEGIFIYIYIYIYVCVRALKKKKKWDN